MITPAYSVSFLLSINIFVWQNVLYFLDAPRTKDVVKLYPLKPNDPYMGFKVPGQIPQQFSICAGQSWPFLYRPVRVFSLSFS